MIKAAEYEGAFRAAFLGELKKVAAANGGYAPWPGDFDKFASSQLVDDFVKEAIRQFLRGAGQSAKRTLFGGTTAQGIPMKGLLGKAPQLKGAGQRLQQAGARMQETGAQRVQRMTGQKLDPQQLRNLQADMRAVGLKDPGAGRRIAGETVKGIGHDISSSTPIGIAFNPLGKVIGGAAEGGMKGVGKELVRSTGLAGQAGAGGVRGALGRGLQRHAGKVGLGTEVATLGALGGLAHVPLSGAGVLGTGIAKASPVLKAGLAAGGDVLGHIGADVIGTAAQKGAATGGRVVAPLARGVGRLVSAA